MPCTAAELRGERNRGLIVWQLNDVWTGTTWASIEYSGRWKLAHYTLACAQAPVAPVAIHNASDGMLDLGVVYTGATRSARGYGLVVEWFDFYGTLLEQRRFEVHVEQDVGWWGAWQLNATELCGATPCYVRLTLPSADVVSYWTHMPSLTASLAQLSAHARPNITMHAHHPPDAQHWHIRITNTGTATAPWLTLTSNTPGYFARPTTLAPPTPSSSTPTLPERSSLSAPHRAAQSYKDWLANLTASSLFDNLPAHTPSPYTRNGTRQC